MEHIQVEGIEWLRLPLTIKDASTSPVKRNDLEWELSDVYGFPNNVRGVCGITEMQEKAYIKIQPKLYSSKNRRCSNLYKYMWFGHRRVACPQQTVQSMGYFLEISYVYV